MFEGLDVPGMLQMHPTSYILHPKIYRDEFQAVRAENLTMLI